MGSSSTSADRLFNRQITVHQIFGGGTAAALINRPAPPVPDLYLSEEMMEQVSAFVRVHINRLLLVSQDIVMGREPGLFFRVAGYLLLITIVGGFADFITLGYLCLIVLLTIPVLYERYEDYVDRSLLWIYRSLLRLYFKVDEYICMLRNLDLEKIKVD